jgi:hypothetical protein
MATATYTITLNIQELSIPPQNLLRMILNTNGLFPVLHKLVSFVIQTGCVSCAVWTVSFNIGQSLIKLLLQRITNFLFQIVKLSIQ